MIDEHRKIIEDFIEENSDMKQKFLDFQLDSNFQSLLSQLDLFKVVSGLVVGIIGIGYFYNINLDKNFLFISIIFAILTLLLSMSYTREVIDFQFKENESTWLKIKKITDDGTEVAIKSLQKNDSKIFFDYAQERLKDKRPSPQLIFTGEIILFFLYSSIGFLLLSFFSFKHQFPIISCQTAILLSFVYLLAFKNWSIRLSTFLSRDIKK